MRKLRCVPLFGLTMHYIQLRTRNKTNSLTITAISSPFYYKKKIVQKKSHSTDQNTHVTVDLFHNIHFFLLVIALLERYMYDCHHHHWLWHTHTHTRQFIKVVKKSCYPMHNFPIFPIGYQCKKNTSIGNLRSFIVSGTWW